MNKKEKYFSESMLREKPKRKLALQIAPNAVTTDKIAPNAVTADKVHPSVIKDLVRPITDDLQNQIDSLTINGMAVSNEFGGDPHIGVSQKTLTEAFSKVWEKISDFTGESMQGISLTVSPSYYIGEEGCTLHITATSAQANGVFEKITFYLDGVEIEGATASDVSYFEFDTEIDGENDSYVVGCVAKIMGIEYEQIKTISRYNL